MVIFLNYYRSLPISHAKHIRRSKDGKHKPSSSNDIHNLVLHVHPMLAHGSEGRIRMENGTTAVFSRIALFYSLSLRLQEVA